MNITELNRPTLDRLRKELNAQLYGIAIEGVSIALGSCSYDSGQAALKMFAKLDGIDLDKEHPYYKLVEFHSKKRQYPYIYTDSRRPNARFKGSTDWAVRHFGKVKVSC